MKRGKLTHVDMIRLFNKTVHKFEFSARYISSECDLTPNTDRMSLDMAGMCRHILFINILYCAVSDNSTGSFSVTTQHVARNKHHAV